MAKKSVKKLPRLQTEEEVDRWVQESDLTHYFTGEEFQKVKSQPVTLRLPQQLVQKLKLAAIRKGIPYQTLARMLLQSKVNKILLS